MKTITSMYIDVELIKEAKQIIPNFSKEFTKFLEIRVAQSKGNLSGININILKKELEREQEVLDSQTIKVNHLTEQIKLLEQRVKQSEIDHLKNEKDVALKVKKCVICGNNIEGETKKEIAWITDEKDFYVESNCLIDWIETRIKNSQQYTKKDLKVWCGSRVETGVSE